MIQALAVLIVAGLVAGGLAGAGVLKEEEGGSGGAAAAPAAGSNTAVGATPSDPEREPTGGEPSQQAYCVADQELERAGRELFAKLGRENASRAESRRAFRNFILENGDRIDTLREQAPPAIESDVRTVIASNLAQGGVAGPAPDKPQVRAARKRVTRYEKKNC